ncbi:MAG: hypothetical protein KBT03_01385 [Bacteroidales bacterium]|nr:hypothetical protein [Candidatus Scybalousia scybalohippi]
MKTKEYLGQIKKINTILVNKQLEILEYKEMATKTTVPTDQERVQTSGTSDTVGNNTSIFVDKENELKEEQRLLTNIRDEIIREMEMLTNPMHYDVLFLKYVDDKTLEYIACEKDYSYVQIKRIHNKALLEFEKLHGSTYLDKEIECRFRSTQ